MSYMGIPSEEFPIFQRDYNHRCPNCDATMTYNYFRQTWECPECGEGEEERDEHNA